MVVVALEGTQRGCGVSLVEDQETVEEFAADRPDEALGDRVRPRRAHRCLDDPDVDGGEDGVEGDGELGVAVADEEPEPSCFAVLASAGCGPVGGDDTP
jgi:hypothetical protein